MSALRLGYMRQDLAVMPYGEVIFDLAALNDDRQKEHESDVAVTKATQADIRSMLG